jgi:hypothetical protein
MRDTRPSYHRNSLEYRRGDLAAFVDSPDGSVPALDSSRLPGLTIGMNNHKNSHLLQFIDSVRSFCGFKGFKGFKRLTYLKLPLIP